MEAGRETEQVKEKREAGQGVRGGSAQGAEDLGGGSCPSCREFCEDAASSGNASGLGGGSSAARLVPVEAEPLLLLLLAHAAIGVGVLW